MGLPVYRFISELETKRNPGKVDRARMTKFESFAKLDIPLWSRPKHGSVITFLSEVYYPKITQLNWDNFEIAAFANRLFVLELREKVTKSIIAVCKKYGTG